MKKYNHKEVESRWQDYWKKNNTYAASNDSGNAKYYVLDMFPYPSGAGLHVGHPLGYVASDIYAKYKKLKGYNVLHPMGFDSFGLPAEQYAIETGAHPADTTAKNIEKYKSQLKKIGLGYDWSREVVTSSPQYYKWTQWIFMQLFNSWYDKNEDKARSINDLIQIFSKYGSKDVKSACNKQIVISAEEWNTLSEKEQYKILLNYRLAYLSDIEVNWCPKLGTVLANEEVKDGVSERGGFPVIRKKMRQWSLRITAYADRLLEDLELLDWSKSIKEIQKYWIGKSKGLELSFAIDIKNKNKILEDSYNDTMLLPFEDVSKNYQYSIKNNDISNNFIYTGYISLRVFTTRPDTIFGVTFLALAPEHSILSKIELSEEVQNFIKESKNRSELERNKNVNTPKGIYSGYDAIHPISEEKIPIWISEYVLIEYGTGAIMAVPAHDSRDYAFALYYGLPIKEVVKGGNVSIEAYESIPNSSIMQAPSTKKNEKVAFEPSSFSGEAKAGTLINSGFLNGLEVNEAVEVIQNAVDTYDTKGDLPRELQNFVKNGKAQVKVNYKLRDAIFSRQRYWGEPFPVCYKDGIPYLLKESELPLELPEVENYKPTEKGEPPLANAKSWKTKQGYNLELNTMPGWAGSSWYFFRYMDALNNDKFVSKENQEYWKQVNLYIGGAEHATGHLIYSRFWTKFLYDLDFISIKEPFKKLINQGMIQGISKFVYRVHVVGAKNSMSGVMNPDEIANSTRGGNLTGTFVSYGLRKDYPTTKIHVDVSLVKNGVLDIEGFKKWRKEYADAEFKLEDGKYICGSEVEKMSKSKHNTVNPDTIVDKYGADTLRLYSMFLGPLEHAKPWSTDGIEGVNRFIFKLWKLFQQSALTFQQSTSVSIGSINKNDSGIHKNTSHNKEDNGPQKTINTLIRKIEDDLGRYSFNTCVSAFMICVNELTTLNCNDKNILEKLLVCLSPFAPHICEELWECIGNKNSIFDATFPKYDEKFLQEDSIEYPVAINGKTKIKLSFAVNMNIEEIEKEVLDHKKIIEKINGRPIKKVIVVPKKMINIVV